MKFEAPVPTVDNESQKIRTINLGLVDAFSHILGVWKLVSVSITFPGNW